MRSAYDDYSEQDKEHIRAIVAEFYKRSVISFGRYQMRDLEQAMDRVPFRLQPLFRMQLEMDDPNGVSRMPAPGTLSPRER